jgi:photosynthesis system II assembly factor YCF48-like protein
MTKSFDDLLRETLHEGAARPAGDCLDAESIAGWIDGTLRRGDRPAAEAHMANCARCQAMLAAMAKTAPPQVAHSWRHAYIRWLVPLAVAAASVLVWVNMPRRAAEAPVAATSPAPIAPDTATQDQLTSQAVDRLAPAAERRDPPATRTNAARNDAVAKRAAAPANEDARARDFNVAVPGASAEPLPADAARPTPPAAAAVPPQTLRETTAVAGPARTSAQVRSTARQTLLEASNASTRWRIVVPGPGGAGGGIQRSMDGGSTWETQATGATSPLTAIASPSQSVCWAVGPAGLVLLTIDGRTWQRLDFPEVVDLASILATDDRSATVITIDGRAFTTTNRGQTWERRGY